MPKYFCRIAQAKADGLPDTGGFHLDMEVTDSEKVMTNGELDREKARQALKKISKVDAKGNPVSVTYWKQNDDGSEEEIMIPQLVE